MKLVKRQKSHGISARKSGIPDFHAAKPGDKKEKGISIFNDFLQNLTKLLFLMFFKEVILFF